MREEPSYLEKSNNCHLIVGNQRVHILHGSQGADCGTSSLLQPGNDVVSLPASCINKMHNQFKRFQGQNSISGLPRQKEEEEEATFMLLSLRETQIWVNRLSCGNVV